MKTCIHCGREMKEGAKFCPACGMAVPENAPEIKVARAPEVRERPKQRRAQQPVSRSGHMQNALADASAPAPKKKRGLKWWHIAAAVLLVIAAAGGVLAYRAHKPYREARITYEDGRTCVQTFDEKGRILTETIYENGEIWGAYDYESAEGKGKKLVANVEQREGVAHAECKEQVAAVYWEGELDHYESCGYVITGYDRFWNVVIECESYNGSVIDGAFRYENDLFGNPVLKYRPVLGHKTEYENHYVFGRLVSSDCTYTEYSQVKHFTIEYIY